MECRQIQLDYQWLKEQGDKIFPPAEEADEHGLLAYGGELTRELLLVAYARGLFPWYTPGEPVLWWCPDPRMILMPEWFKPSKSLRRKVRSGVFEVRSDTCFDEVIRHCARVPRPGQEGTWITPEMERAYFALHEEGFAHSIEVFHEGGLAGGLYGVSLGKAFFGESMFYLVSDASKVAFYFLVEFLKKHEFHLIDAQVTTKHLKNLGGREVPRKAFLGMLEKALQFPTLQGKWEVSG